MVFGREQEFEAHVGVFHAARVAGRLIGHEWFVAFALLPLRAQSEGKVVFHNRAGHYAGNITRFLVAQTQAQRAFPFVGRIFGTHHHRARHRVLPAHMALRPAQDFHLLHVPQRLRAEGVFVVSGGAAVYGQVQARPRAREKRHRTDGGTGAVHAAHGRQIVAAAQVHRVHGLFEQVGCGKVVAAAVDVRRGENAVGRGGFKAAAVGAFAGDDDFFQLHLFRVLRRIGGINPFGGESGGKQQRQAAEGGFLHFLILSDGVRRAD